MGFDVGLRKWLSEDMKGVSEIGCPFVEAFR